jgi:hypothetical protein
MRRREFIALLGGGAAWPLAARAQQAGKQPIIGFLGSATAAVFSPWTSAFVARLRELGWNQDGTVVRSNIAGQTATPSASLRSRQSSFGYPRSRRQPHRSGEVLAIESMSPTSLAVIVSISAKRGDVLCLIVPRINQCHRRRGEFRTSAESHENCCGL